MDTMVGGDGNDTYVVDNIVDIVTESSTDLAQIDTVESGISYFLGSNVENLLLTGVGNIHGGGNILDNILTGNSGNNSLNGGEGNDIMAGGAGNDYYDVDAVDDQVIENDGEGSDTVFSYISYTLGANLEDLFLEGTTDLNGTGNTFDNFISGNSGANILDGGDGDDLLDGGEGNDILDGGDGNDHLWGGEGNDIMAGGAGNDYYDVYAVDDQVIENDGEGDDNVFSYISYTLGANLEDLFLEGTTDLNGTGNTLDNSISGNSGANILDGGDGDDFLSGGSGNDSLLGGEGNDIMGGGAGDDNFYVDAVGDWVFENAAGGTDLVQSTINYTLGANVENLTLTGTAAINGKGNDLNNILTGNSGANILAGGLGNDTYVADNAGDVVTESSTLATEIDTVQSSVSFTLGANIENLTLTGTAAINGTGNDLNNILTGNSGANILAGGLGNDTYVVDNAGDIVTESSTLATEIDTVQLSVSFTLGANIENLTLTGTAAINGTGNNLDNILLGNSGANRLGGGLGNDTLTGGVGNDTFVFDSALDATSNDDTITDFIVGQDNIQLNKHIFTSLASLGDLSTDNFRSSSNGLALDSDDYILYNTSSGELFYDADGNGSGDAIQFATLTTMPALSAADISVINTAVGIVLDGNFDDNILDGGDGDDTLNGYGGHDTLNGYGGNDTMVGGTGDDSYYVDAVGDLVVENDGEGNDFVLSYISYTLGDNLENLHLDPDATADLNGTGNTINNTIWGNSGANILDGGDGDDFLDGGQGNDTMIGGTGNDIFLVDAVGDQVIENDGEGNDYVYSNICYTLGANLENLALWDTTDLNGTGNTLDNWIDGNSGTNILDGGNGDDLLDGGQGSDTMIGGAGNDNYYVDAVGDMVVENDGEGYDSVFVRVSYTLGANLEDLSLKGTGGGIWYGVECTADINGTGNSLNNYIEGNNGNNILDGGDGDDVMAGGLGNDTLTGGVGNDTFVFDTALNATSNNDTISDFTAGLDKIQVDNDIFTSLTATGSLLVDYFKSSDTGLASDGNDYLLYNTTSGELFYDADGSGSGVAVQFATLTTKPTITEGDFLIVA